MSITASGIISISMVCNRCECVVIRDIHASTLEYITLENLERDLIKKYKWQLPDGDLCAKCMKELEELRSLEKGW